MKGLTRAQLLEYVKTKRDDYYARWEACEVECDEINGEQMWIAFEEMDTIYRCMVDNDFAKSSYRFWTGKEL